MGRTTARERAVNWEKLGYVLIGHMVDWGEKEEKHAADRPETDYQLQDDEQSVRTVMIY